VSASASRVAFAVRPDAAATDAEVSASRAKSTRSASQPG
jgi:hypothetical protein